MGSAARSGRGEGRDARGRFSPGHRIQPSQGDRGRGNGVGRLRAALAEAISDEDLAELIRAQVEAAISGDSQAARLVLSYLAGHPRQMPAEAIKLPPMELSSQQRIRSLIEWIGDRVLAGEIDPEQAEMLSKLAAQASRTVAADQKGGDSWTSN